MIKGITQFAVTRRVTVAMMAISFMLFGGIALKDMPVTLLPSLEYPTFTVRTEYENAGPEEIELLITKPIEESVGVVKGISRVYSVSSTGRSDVKLEFNWDADIKRAAYDIRDRIDAVRLPLDADPPVLLRFNPATDPIMQVALVLTVDDASVESFKSLRTYADFQLKKKLDPVAGVAAVKISGGYEKQIQILPDQYKLAQLGLSIDTISSRLKAENINLTGGAIKQANKLYLVRTVNQFEDINAIKNLIITSMNGTPIRISDVAKVTLGHKDRKSINRLNGQETVEIAIYKEGDSNTVSVAKAVREKLDEIKKDLPPDSEIRIIEDQSIFIDDAIGNVISAALLGGLLAILVIYLFLREFLATVIIAILIPVSVISGFFFMLQAGVSLNIMSLGGIALAVGLLVDNGIVVLENIAAKKKEASSVLESVQKGTEEVGGAIVASTLTTVAVFLPLVFVYGIAGQLFKDQALTVTFTLLVSLIFALLLIPMLSSLKHRKSLFRTPSGQDSYEPKTRIGGFLQGTRKGIFNNGLDWLFLGIKRLVQGVFWVFKTILYVPAKIVDALYQSLYQIYIRVLPWSLNHRLIILVLCFGFFAMTAMLLPRLGIDLIPDLEADKVKLSFQLAEGETIESTDAFFRQISEQIEGRADVEFVYGISGEGNKLDTSALTSGENAGQMVVTMKPGTDKAALEDEILSIINQRPGVLAEVEAGQFFDLAIPIEIELSGYDLRLLEQGAVNVARALSGSDSFINVNDGIESGNPEIQLYFDQERISALGFSVAQVANNVVNKVLGKSETTVHWNDQKVELLVRTAETQRNSIEDVRNLIINPDSNSVLRLSDVAEVNVTQGPGKIIRRNQDRVIVVSADISGTTLAEAAAEAERLVSAANIHPLVRVKVTGQNEELKASNQSMIFALSLAVFLVYMVLASQFESLLHPFIILISIPLALTGAIWALYLTHTNISVVVFIGMIMLAGIVVNNAIVLIDLIKQLMEKGASVRDAIIEAGKSRLRPIIMTTITTILGLLPMAITIGSNQAGAEIRAPMAITVIGGLLLATFLTLIVIPVFFSLLTKESHG